MSEGLNTELVSSWREAMEGVTPGPWIKVEDDSFDETILVTTEERNGNRCPISATAAGFTEPFDSEQRANAAWIARCSPSDISVLLDALESTSRALSEKEGELAERDRWVMHWQTKCQATRALEIEATRQRDEALAALKGAREALEPFARIAEEYADQEDDDFQVWRDFDVLGATLPLRIFRRARSALENAPSTLADATKKDPGTEQREAGL